MACLVRMKILEYHQPVLLAETGDAPGSLSLGYYREISFCDVRETATG
jgi:hypothetical protein